MRIGIDCHVLEKTKTGVARYLTNLLRYWKEIKGVDFILYSLNSTPNPLKVKSTVLYYNFSLPCRAKKDKLDILFLPFYMRPFFCKVPTAVAIHDISFFTHPEWFDFYHRFAYRILAKRAIKKSKIIFACSEYTKKEILKHCLAKDGAGIVNPEKIYTVLLAADEEFNNNKNWDKIIETKKKYELKDKYLFYTGSLFNRRHILETIEAFKLILKERPNYQLLISGRNLTNPHQDIEGEIKRINKNFPNVIIKTDYVDESDLIHLYQGSDLFVYLSEYEGFGLPPLEAMACGTPVLTTKKTSLGEVLGDYPIWVEMPNNIEEIKEKMLKILSDENLRDEMIKKGLKRAKQFSWQKAAEKTYELLQRSGK